MTDKELIRRALLGDQQAQQACTDKGIALTCPFCQEDKRFAKWDVKGGAFVECLMCHAMSGLKSSRAKALKSWNTRPAPPVGRCKDCINATNPGSNIVFCDYFERDMMPDDFCSCFEPKEG